MRDPAELEALVHEYVDGVRDGSIVTGRLERLAVERHVRDLGRKGKRRGLRFNKRRALRAMWWIEARCRFTKGEWAGQSFRLAPWQAFVVWCLFGWEKRSGKRWLRRFRMGYVSVARKNGKTELAAAIALVFLVVPGEAEPGGEIYSAATKRDQAAICWTAAAGMVKRSPLLRAEVGVHPSRHNLAHYDSESKLETVSSDANTLDGLGPLMAVIDEYHAHADSSVLDVLETGQGARREPLLLVTTTAGEKREGACWELETDGVKVLEGIGEAEGSGDDLFVYVARLDEGTSDAPGDDWNDRRTWRRANPNLGVSLFPEKLEVSYQAAKRRPGAVGEFLRKHCNMWTEASTAWLGMPQWDACAASVPEAELEGARCFAGVDLSATSDYTAAVAVFPPAGDRELWGIKVGLWIPAETLVERSKTDRVPVMRWAEDGLVTPTPGNVVDQDAVKEWLLNLRERHEVVEVPCDPHNATALQTQLLGLGFEVSSMRQGWITMSPAIKQTEILIRQKLLAHGGHPVLRWMFSNVSVKRDANDNLSLHKGRSADRIDGVVALVMGVGRAVSWLEDVSKGGSRYNDGGQLTIFEVGGGA